MSPPRAFIFDVDGTILDTFHQQYEWLRHVAADFKGVTPFPAYDDAFRESYSDWLVREKMPGLYTMIGVDFFTHQEEIWRRYNEFNAAHAVEPVPGIVDGISQLASKGMLLALNTTKKRENITTALERAGIAELFHPWVTKDDLYDAVSQEQPFLTPDERERAVINLEKPHPYSAQLVLQRLGLAASDVVALEDTASGIETYSRSGIVVYGVLWGYDSRDRLRKARPQGILETPADILRL